MQQAVLAIVSPGAMGQAIARVVVHHGAPPVLTCLEGRSERTKSLASDAGIEDVKNFQALFSRADVILSVLVPSNAFEVVEKAVEAANSVGSGKKPIFVDLNALAPNTVKDFDVKLAQAGLDLVDGCILGPPPQVKTASKTKIYLSGKRAEEVQVILKQYGLDVRVLGPEIGQASGLKMFYSTMMKGIIALGTEAMVGSKALGLYDAFTSELKDSAPDVLQRLESGVPGMCPKAYRFHGEMEEIAHTYEDIGLTPTIFKGAAELYRFVESTPLGKEVVEDRKRGKTLDDAVAVMTEHLRR